MSHKSWSWKDIRAALVAQGWKIESNDGERHAYCVPPDKSKAKVRVACETDDWRGMRKAVSDLRKSGFVYGREDDETPTSSRLNRGDLPSIATMIAVFLDDIGITREKGSIIGTAWRRTDRLDPRDPKTIVSYDEATNKIGFKDRRGKRVVRALSDFVKDLGAKKLMHVSTEVLDAMPEVTDAPFAQALQALRIACDTTQEDIASMLGDEGLSGAAISAWESGTCSPIRRHYQQLLLLWPELHEANKPNSKRPHYQPHTGPRDNVIEGDTPESKPTIVPTISSGLRQLRRVLQRLEPDTVDRARKLLDAAGLGELGNALVSAKKSIDNARPRMADDTNGSSVVWDGDVPDSSPSSGSQTVDYIETFWELVNDLFRERTALRFHVPDDGEVWTVEAEAVEMSGSGDTPRAAMKRLLVQLHAHYQQREDKLRAQRERLNDLMGDQP